MVIACFTAFALDLLKSSQSFNRTPNLISAAYISCTNFITLSYFSMCALRI